MQLECIINSSLEYLHSHEEDPGNILLGSPVSPYLLSSTLRSNFRGTQKNLTTDHQEQCDDNKIQMGLQFEAYLRKWDSLRFGPDLVMSDIADLVKGLDKRLIFKYGEIVTVNVKGICDADRIKFTNDKWEKVSQMTYVYGRICKDIESLQQNIDVRVTRKLKVFSRLFFSKNE